MLGGLLILTMSPAVVAMPRTDCVEPALIWLSICMTTGTRAYQNILRLVCGKVGFKGKSAERKLYLRNNVVDGTHRLYSHLKKINGSSDV